MGIFGSKKEAGIKKSINEQLFSDAAIGKIFPQIDSHDRLLGSKSK